MQNHFFLALYPALHPVLSFTWDLNQDPWIYVLMLCQLRLHNYIHTGPNTRFEFGQQYECIKLLPGASQTSKILQTDRSLLFCFISSVDGYTLPKRPFI